MFLLLAEYVLWWNCINVLQSFFCSIRQLDNCKQAFRKVSRAISLLFVKFKVCNKIALFIVSHIRFNNVKICCLWAYNAFGGRFPLKLNIGGAQQFPYSLSRVVPLLHDYGKF